MRDENLKAAIAPCGLSCEKCFAHVDGDIRRYATQLRDKLGNFGPYADRFGTLLEEPVFASYPAFREMLDYFAGEHCTGCRNEQCRMFQGCGVRPCHQEKGVDYCFECEDFPCDRTGFDPQLYAAWVKINGKIREKGLEAYYAYTQKASRYV